MKKLEELGISPAPWDCEGTVHVGSNASMSNHVCTTQAWAFDRHADARLIAAAPELYEALYLIMICWGSSVFDEGGMICDVDKSDIKHCRRCHPQDCPIYLKARKALAKAAGETIT